MLSSGYIQAIRETGERSDLLVLHGDYTRYMEFDFSYTCCTEITNAKYMALLNLLLVDERQGAKRVEQYDLRPPYYQLIKPSLDTLREAEYVVWIIVRLDTVQNIHMLTEISH